MTKIFPTLIAGLALGLCATTAGAVDNFTDGVTISDAASGTADLFVSDNTVLDGHLCVGNGCTATETFLGTDVAKLKDFVTSILFDDVSTDPNYPSRDWRVQINDATNFTSGGMERFSVEDVTAGTTPFTIEGDSDDNALYVTEHGRVGLGTSSPQSTLHIARGGYPSIIFEDLGMVAGGPYSWRVVASEYGFIISDYTTRDSPFQIKRDAENYMFHIGPTGIGIGGPFLSDATLHVQRDDGTAQVKLEEITATTSPRTLLNLQNNGRPDIVLGNSSTGGEWSFGAGTNFVLKQGAVGSLSSAKTKLFEIQSSGDAVLAGTLTTGGPSCSGGCDAVFSDGYDLPSVEEHASAMFALGHLPGVGPTTPGAPLNLSERYGNLLNELEHAHIYIARQNEIIETLSARVTALEQR